MGLAKVLVRRAAAAFGDIGGNRKRRSPQLIDQSSITAARDSLSQTMDIQPTAPKIIFPRDTVKRPLSDRYQRTAVR